MVSTLCFRFLLWSLYFFSRCCSALCTLLPLSHTSFPSFSVLSLYLLVVWSLDLPSSALVFLPWSHYLFFGFFFHDFTALGPGDITDRKKYRSFSLLFYITKLFARMLQRRMEKIFDKKTAKGRGRFQKRLLNSWSFSKKIYIKKCREFTMPPQQIQWLWKRIWLYRTRGKILMSREQ